MRYYEILALPLPAGLFIFNQDYLPFTKKWNFFRFKYGFFAAHVLIHSSVEFG